MAYTVNAGTISLLYSNVPENDYPAYSATTTYALNATVMVISDTQHKVYQSLIANNVGNPVTDATKWLDIGNTNRWKMHDGSVQSQTVNPAAIHHQYKVEGLCDTVVLLNVNAASVQVRMFDAVDGIVYDNNISLSSIAGVDNWYDYFFSPITVLSTDAIISGLPPYANSIIEIIVSSPISDAAVGALLLGQSIDIGQTQYGAKVGITDYSVKTQDSFGNYSITKRPYRKIGDFQVMVDNNFIDRLQIMLAQYRAQPVLYIGTESYGSNIIYGFYRDFDITVSYPTSSLCSINIEGLT